MTEFFVWLVLDGLLVAVGFLLGYLRRGDVEQQRRSAAPTVERARDGWIVRTPSGMPLAHIGDYREAGR